MNSHDEYAALLDAFLDGELSGAEAEGVRVHLSECADCQAYVADALAIRDAFPDIGETVVPDGFAESVLAALPPRRAHWAKIALPLAACAALVILLHGIDGRRAPGGGASMSSYTEEAATTADADAGGAVSDDVPPQTPELYGVAESQAVQNATADKTESGMTPFAMRSSGTEAPEEAEEESVSNGRAAPAAAKAIPDGYAVEEAFPDEAPATGVAPEEETKTAAVPGEGAATDAFPVGVSVPESVREEGAATVAEHSASAPRPDMNALLSGESETPESREIDETADLSSGAVSVWTLPAEALDLFDGYAPAEQTESGIWYALTPGEFDTLSQKLDELELEIVPGDDAPPPTARPGMEYVFVPL